MALSINPLKLSIEPVPRGAEKVQLGIVKRHPRRDFAVCLQQRQHQPGKERSIRNLIDNRWTGRQSTILNSEMWNTFRNSVTRAIPAPHRTVVALESRKRRCFTARQDGKRIFFRLRDHDRTKASDLIVKELDDGIFQPLIAEINTRRLVARELRTRALVS